MARKEHLITQSSLRLCSDTDDNDAETDDTYEIVITTSEGKNKDGIRTRTFND
jgi:hypothetical protein